MLRTLFIRHFAIIENLRLEFQPGLNVLSGETGAGKSILMQALGLVLGERGQTALVRSGEERCEVMAEFDIGPGQVPIVSQFFNEENLPFTERIVLKRILSKSGKSRAWIGEAPVTLDILQRLRPFLVELVLQHQSQKLLQPETALEMVDRFGGHAALIADYQKAFETYLSILKQKEMLEREIAKTREREALFRFELQEILNAELKIGEEEKIVDQKNVLKNAARLHEVIQKVEGLVVSEDGALLEKLDLALKALSKISGIESGLDAAIEALGNARELIDQNTRFLESYLDRFDFDPVKLDALEFRLDQIARLKKKYGPSIPEILSYAETIAEKLRYLDLDDSKSSVLEKASQEALLLLKKQAMPLSLARKEAAEKLAFALESQFSALAMDGTRVDLRILPLEGAFPFSNDGTDFAEWWISPNRGEDFKPLASIASGGELSRTLLGLKIILGTLDSTPSYVFDEIDTGMSGATAEKVGRKMKELAAEFQVICITHLPQIVACADHHFRIFKEEENGRVTTRIVLLDPSERIEELARMLAGTKITAQALSHAKELLEVVGTNLASGS